MATKNLQSGRSMTEMLGVLAIIGVLSIGAIGGYSYGMDKWRANEIINDVNMRMIDIATQVHNQSEIAIPEDWDIKGRSGYIIDVFQNTDSEPSIMVEKVPSSVCKMVLQNTPYTQDIYVGILNGDQVDGNWYLGDNDNICDGSDKEMLFALDASILNNLPDMALECQSNADCNPDKPYCDNGICKECTEDSQCPNENPRCDIEKGVCHECVSNDDCDAGQFCADTNESKCEARPYTCKDLDFGECTVDGTTYYISKDSMTWWDADAFCKALGSDGLVSVSDIINGWNGGHDPVNHEFTTLGQALHTYSGIGDWVWPSDSESRCYSYYVSIRSGYTASFGLGRNGHYHHAVCRR